MSGFAQIKIYLLIDKGKQQEQSDLEILKFCNISMKKIILLIIIFILANDRYANAGLGFLNYSYSREIINEKNIQNHSIGPEILFGSDIVFRSYNFFGLNYKFSDSGNTLTSHYLINHWEFLTSWSLGYFVMMPVIGANVSYNLDNKFWGTGPRIDLVNMIFMLVKINITYRYNVYFQAKNSHEIGFTVGVSNFFL